MKNNHPPKDLHQKTLSRDTYLRVVQTAISVNEFRFAREAVLDWLTTYPGDLKAGLLYAEALLGDGYIKDALPILAGLCNADPEFQESALLWLEAEARSRLDGLTRFSSNTNQRSAGMVGQKVPPYSTLTIRSLQTYVYALIGEEHDSMGIDSWGEDVWQARRALAMDDLDTARRRIRDSLDADPPLPLAAVTHLRYLERSQVPLPSRLQIAERYNARWSDCLPCSLYLAGWSLEVGDSAAAVALLHQAAARDISGQVANRLWRKSSLSRDLWPTNLELSLRLPIPAPVASMVGMNQLVDGTRGESSVADLYSNSDNVAISSSPMKPSQTAKVWAPVIHSENDGGIPEWLECGIEEQESISTTAALQSEEMSIDVQEAEGKDAVTHQSEKDELRHGIEELGASHAFPGITRLDGRFPVYVVFSTRSGLQTAYGPRAAKEIEMEMRKLVEAVHDTPGWNARLFLADDPVGSSKLDILPVKHDDPWALKLAITDLDMALVSSGEMIGALLIVGDPEAVPYHDLPNPLDDQDDNVSSDNPYATRDKNYFIPEWPVGRLPAGGDSKLLVELLQRIRKVHECRCIKVPWYQRLIQRFRSWLLYEGIKPRTSFGYTAAIWRRAAAAVYRPIGNPRAMQVSPPRGVYDGTFLDPVDPAEPQEGLEGGVPLPVGKLGYFNLHGLVDASEWYGQRDPLEVVSGTDYPVALRPEDIEIAANGKGSNIPKIVFSEACYGMHIVDRAVDQAMALKFLQAGTTAVAGSTCMAYGSVNTPLIAADLLGYEFWRALENGIPAGEALRQAKIALANEMDRRQGFLDGEDQKTLISFILYGDPLAQIGDGALQQKSVLRLATPLPEVKTVCDRLLEDNGATMAPADVLTSVRDVVSHYLPGMSDADISVAYTRAGCDGHGHNCPTSQLHQREAQSKGGADFNGNNLRLVTLSKLVPRTEGIHAHYARMTLDQQGGLVKLVVSR